MLQTRLEMILDLIPKCSVLCDVGTDHCKLAAMAICSRKVEKAYATDINEGPLSAAKRLIEAKGLSDKIIPLLSDGFLALSDSVFNEIDCFVIAGMGGELISRIISDRHTDKYIVCQPMTAITELKEFVCAQGYDIITQTFCKEGNKIYTAFLIKYSGKKTTSQPYGNAEKTELYYQYLEREKARLLKAIRGIESSEKSDKSRIFALKQLLSQAQKESNK